MAQDLSNTDVMKEGVSRFLFDVSPEPMAVFVDGRLAMVNESLSVWLGYDWNELQGKREATFINPCDKDRDTNAEAYIGTVMTAGGLQRIEVLKHSLMDDCREICICVLRVLSDPVVSTTQQNRLVTDVPGRMAELEERTQELELSRLAALSLMEDSEILRQKSEDALEKLRVSERNLHDAKDAAESANRAKSAFIANMSHEIRTPMNAVLGFSDVLASQENDPEKKRLLECIQQSGNALLDLINDILDLSKVEAGKLDLQPVPILTRGIFNDVENIFRKKAQDKGLEFAWQLTEDLPEVLIIDQARLRQILINLLSNALKFTNEGQIRVIITCRRLVAPENHVALLISVEDTGIGIPEDQQETIFDVFQQMAGQNVSQYGGTGLGLAITRRLVGLMNGEISLRSVPGKGSLFQVILNGVEIGEGGRTTVCTADLADETPCFEPATLLVADDLEVNRELLKIFLSDWDFRFLEAENGQEVMALVKDDEPDLILLDMKMPRMDGYEVVSLLKDDDSLKHIPVLAVTASALKRDKKLISRLCDGFLPKPVSKQSLIEALKPFLKYTLPEKGTVSASYDLTPEILDKVPVAWRSDFLGAARGGFFDELLKLLDDLREDFPDLAVNLETLVQGFQYEKLIQLFSKKT